MCLKCLKQNTGDSQVSPVKTEKLISSLYRKDKSSDSGSSANV